MHAVEEILRFVCLNVIKCSKWSELFIYKCGFLSVVVITCPSHGQGRRFDPGRNQALILFCFKEKVKFLKSYQFPAKLTKMLKLAILTQVARWSRGMILA